MHTAAKLLQCDECGYSCSTSGGLKLHKRTHSGERPYMCDECGLSCSTSGDLKLHKRTHSGEKPYHCDTCDYKSTQSCHLIRHKRKHTDERDQCCSIHRKTDQENQRSKIERKTQNETAGEANVDLCSTNIDGNKPSVCPDAYLLCLINALEQTNDEFKLHSSCFLQKTKNIVVTNQHEKHCFY